MGLHLRLQSKVSDNGSLVGSYFSSEEKEELAALWDTLNTEIFEIWCEYPAHDGTYEQNWSGVLCRRIEGTPFWVCSDEQDGFYAANQQDVDRWALVTQQ